MIEAKCPVCSGPELRFMTANDVNLKISSIDFHYNRCSACGFICLKNVPSDLGAYYPNTYYDIPKDRESLRAANSNDQYKIELVQSFVKHGRLLEIGPAFGSFACLANEAGFNVDVIEMDERCCEFIKAKLGINAIQADNPISALSEMDCYNVITLWQVIEHLPDPFASLRVVVDKLKPGGTLVLSTPNPQAIQFRILGRFWAHLDAPRHITLLPMKLMIEKMEILGLECVFATTTDKGSLGWDSFGWAVSFRNFFSNQKSRNIAHLFGRVLTKLLIPIERTNKRGSSYTVVFRKKGI